MVGVARKTAGGHKTEGEEKAKIGAKIVAKAKNEVYREGYDAGYAAAWKLGGEAGALLIMKILRNLAMRDGSDYLLRVVAEADAEYKERQGKK